MEGRIQTPYTKLSYSSTQRSETIVEISIMNNSTKPTDTWAKCTASYVSPPRWKVPDPWDTITALITWWGRTGKFPTAVSHSHHVYLRTQYKPHQNPSALSGRSWQTGSKMHMKIQRIKSGYEYSTIHLLRAASMKQWGPKEIVPIVIVFYSIFLI